jgi:diaminohydroxyphosphoribosylaminopyrimidine deaminase/5-amino-6-(5-phosphoribosylamino)uracil reductase
MSAWDVYMAEAVGLALSADVASSSNPRVGCVIVDPHGAVVGRGHHRGAGTPHAEVEALAEAGDRAAGATAVVTLEPCRHTGRTGPCTEALVAAGVHRVVYAVDDPGVDEGGGAEVLRAAGVEVVSGVLQDEASYANRAWTHARRLGRPLVTLKTAMSLDGRVADAAGGPTPITGPESRGYAHALRGIVDAIAVGTGTVLADDPQLTARAPDAGGAVRQPLRVVVGRTPVSPTARIRDGQAPTLVHASRDLQALMRELSARDVEHLLVEGGPTLAAAFLDAGLVDEVLWFVAPVVLGAGPVALPTLDRRQDVAVRSVRVMGEDVVVEGMVDVHRDR